MRHDLLVMALIRGSDERKRPFPAAGPGTRENMTAPEAVAAQKTVAAQEIVPAQETVAARGAISGQKGATGHCS